MIARRPRRPMDWIGATTSAVQTVAAGGIAAQYTVLPSEILTQFTDPTLIRSRGQLVGYCSVAGLMVAAVGLISWPDNNDTPPVGVEVPDPLNSATHDWIWHAYMFAWAGTCLNYQASEGSPGGTNVDSKAMRRLGGRHGVLFCMSNSAVSVGAANFLFGFRHLLKD